MNALDALAEFVQGRQLAGLPPERFDLVKLHILDTLGALLAGSAMTEGISIGSLVASGASAQGDSARNPGERGRAEVASSTAHDAASGGVSAELTPRNPAWRGNPSQTLEYPSRSSLAQAVMAGCAAARCSEIDDIHLSSCTTPGSVIVPTALALSLAGELRTFREFSASVIAGYELLIRLGYAINGPAMLQRKLWPTYFAAAFGSAATATRAYGLSAEKTAGALATALAFCTGTAITARSPAASRWLTLGAAASNGVLAAQFARDGLRGDSNLLERYGGRLAGAKVSLRRLLKGLGRRFLFDEIGTKPYPIARQALAAVESARELAEAEQVDISTIEDILVRVPGAQQTLIDHPEMPVTRMDSIVSVQYQIALALVAPERLLDVRRAPPFADDRLAKLMAKIRVQHSLELEKYYPAAWPARVKVKAGGRQFSREVLHPRGDASNRFTWDHAERKFRTIARPVLGDAGAESLLNCIRRLDATAETPVLWGFFSGQAAGSAKIN